NKSGKYIDALLPKLPFESSEFDLALCSHYLFLYSEHVSQEQHVKSMKELCRVAKEVRVYPLLSIDSNKESPHLKPVMAELERNGINTSLVSVKYEFQKGATKMLVAKRV
ncbi:class I SAM-dependent methyltransferase, partial [bacterium]|nr:class I SAM-dependent methyltransferase [bacterium]